MALVIVLLSVCAVTACATPGVHEPDALAPGAGAPGVLLCQGDSLDRATLGLRMPVDELDGPAQDIVAAAEYDDGAAFPVDPDWFVGRFAADEVILLRDRVPDAEDPRLYERVTISRLDDRWMVTAHGHCDLTVDLGTHTAPDVAVDPAHDPASTILPLLVTERACNSGQPADGRVHLLSLDERADSVTLVVGIRTLEGPASCPDNPATPFAVELAEPLGDRILYDGAHAPARELIVERAEP